MCYRRSLGWFQSIMTLIHAPSIYPLNPLFFIIITNPSFVQEPKQRVPEHPLHPPLPLCKKRQKKMKTRCLSRSIKNSQPPTTNSAPFPSLPHKKSNNSGDAPESLTPRAIRLHQPPSGAHSLPSLPRTPPTTLTQALPNER